MAKNFKAKTPDVPEAEAKRRHDLMDQIIRTYTGPADELEAALGMYMIGRHVGWKVLYLVHSKPTVAKYEAILGIKVREEFEPETDDSVRSNAFKAARALTNFWKIVSGDDKLPLDRAERRSLG
jgi:hypothetical protein